MRVVKGLFVRPGGGDGGDRKWGAGRGGTRVFLSLLIGVFCCRGSTGLFLSPRYNACFVRFGCARAANTYNMYITAPCPEPNASYDL